MYKVTMLGTGLIGMFYTESIQSGRLSDRVQVVFSRTEKSAKAFAEKHGIPKWTTNMKEAIEDPDTDLVVVGLPNYQHREAIVMAAEAGKAVLCTKPLARTGAEAKECLDAVEKAGNFPRLFGGIWCITPKHRSPLNLYRPARLGKYYGLGRERRTLVLIAIGSGTRNWPVVVRLLIWVVTALK